MFRPRPDLLVAVSVPVLLVAGVLPWQRDVMCTQAGCGTVAASAWTGSPVWALVLLSALAAAGAWVLALPTRGRVSLGVAAVTGVVGVLAAAVVVVSLDALVFNRVSFFHFDLPVTETFPVLAVHPGAGLVLGLVGLLLQAVGGWGSLRQRDALVSPLRPPVRQPVTAGHPSPAAPGWPQTWPPQDFAAPARPAQHEPPAIRTWPSPTGPPPASESARPAWESATPRAWPPAQPESATPEAWSPAESAAPRAWPPAESATQQGGSPGRESARPAPAGWEAAAFGQGPPTPRRHRRR